MAKYDHEDWITGLRIQSDYPNLIQEVNDAYINADSSFTRYFGIGFKPGFIREAHIQQLPSKYKKRSGFVLGQWVPKTRTLKLYPEVFTTLNADSNEARRGILYHEFGHAFDSQSISENLSRKNIAAREAFAELCKIIAVSEGESDKVTSTLSGWARYSRAFLPANRINSYPSNEGLLEDAAFFHYLISDWGIDSFKQFYDTIPPLLKKMEYLRLLVGCHFSQCRLREALYFNMDLQIYRNFFLGGYTIENLTDQAKNWYRRQTEGSK